MKIRWIEIEAEGEAVVAALRTFSAAVGRPVELPAAPVEAVSMPQLAAGPAPRKAKREVHARAGKADDAPGQATTRDAVLAALRDGPKTIQQITSFVRTRGRQDCTIEKVRSSTSWFRLKGMARCDRHTNTWSLDGPAAKETAHA